jgi:DNA polymerase-3 subunit beta
MKITVNLSQFILGVNTVCKAISNRTTLAVLENIYIELIENTLMLRGNDLELGIQYKLPVDVRDASGNCGVLLKSSTLSDILSKLKSETIDFEINESLKCKIKSSSSDFDIYGVALSEYPKFPEIENDMHFQMKSEEILDLIKHTIFSVSLDETKPFLNGIKIESRGNSFDFISTDGFRLSLKSNGLDEQIPEFSCIVPYKTMNELQKVVLYLKTEKIKIQLSERQITFIVGESTMISRLVNGRFPDYQQVLPKSRLFEFKLSRQLLLSAVDRANVIAIHSNYVAKFNFSESQVTISATNSNLGNYVEQLPIQRCQGDRDILLSFNIKLLQDVLKIIDQQDICFELNNELSPCVISPVGDKTYTHILMPIRMSDYAQEKKDSEEKIEEPVTS